MTPAAVIPKAVVAAVCAYEVVAVTTGRVPTVTALCCRHRMLGPLIVVSLAVHFYRAPRLMARTVLEEP